MARFTDPDKWKDSWFRKLNPPEKLLFLYIIDVCDNAGFFEFDAELAAFTTKMKEEHVTGAIKGLKRGLVAADKREELFYVKNFLRHQRNLPLNPENNAHKQIIRLIEEKKISFKSNDSFFRGLLAPLYSKGKGSSKGKGKVEYSKEFETWWEAYKHKGVKFDAFRRWKEAKLPEMAALVAATEKYIAYCDKNDRERRDGAGFISGRLWESEWSSNTAGAGDLTLEDVT